MNALTASIIFVIWALLLSIIKQMLFPSEEPTSRSEMDFQKVFHLTNSEIPQSYSVYQSLYEAYHKSEIMNAQKYTSMLKDRKLFNQSVLRESFLNDEKSFTCGPDFLVLVFSGIEVKNNNMNWVNVFEIFQLPILKKLDQFTIFGHLQLPNMCKNQKQAGKYQIGVINENRPLLLTIDTNGKFVLYSNILEYLDEYSKEILQFDYSARFWAYTSKEQPWVIRIAEKPFSKEDVNIGSIMKQPKFDSSIHSDRLYETNDFLEIDLLDIEMYESDSYNWHQILNIRQILINNLNNLYLTVIYDYHNTRDKIYSIIETSFMIKQETMSLLSRVVLYSDKVIGLEIETDCVKYHDTSSNSYDLSCLVKKMHSDVIQFVSVLDIFNANASHVINRRKSEGRAEEKDHDYSQWIEDHFSDAYDESEDDLLWMLQKMTPLADKSYFKDSKAPKKVNMFSFNFHAPAYTQFKILKGALPDPIFLYTDRSDYYLYSFKTSNLFLKPPENHQSSPQPKHAEFSQLFFKLDKPNSVNEEDNNLRSIRWVEEEQLMMVIWGNGIELYQYFHKNQNNFNSEESDGIAMAAIIPFIELFATVFCMLQLVWNNNSASSQPVHQNN